MQWHIFPLFCEQASLLYTVCTYSSYFISVGTFVQCTPSFFLPLLKRSVVNPDPYVFFWPVPEVRDTDPDPSITKQNDRKNLDSYCFVTSLCLYIFEMLCKCTVRSKRNVQKNFLTFLKQFFVGVLKVNDENSRIQSRIRTNMSRIHNTAEELLLTSKKIIQIVLQRQCLPLPAALPLKLLFSANYYYF